MNVFPGSQNMYIERMVNYHVEGDFHQSSSLVRAEQRSE
jgi:hypothetical protein